MKAIDFIFALVCGWMVNWVAFGFLKSFGVDFGLWRWLLSWVLPAISLICLWSAYIVGKKILFVFQAVKHLLVGIFTTVIDLKIFEFLVWFFSTLVIAVNPIISKGVSFLVSISIKYWGNKYWAFGKHEKKGLFREVSQFFIVTAVGLAIDTGSFFYFTKIIGPQFNLTPHIWTQFSVIFAALISAAWNFLGYKFIVFKK